MDNSNYTYGICGVYCGQCPRGNGRVSLFAGELKRLIDIVRFEFLKNIPEIPFDFAISGKDLNGSISMEIACV